MHYCGNCGNVIKKGAKYCKYCGFDQSENTITYQSRNISGYPKISGTDKGFYPTPTVTTKSTSLSKSKSAFKSNHEPTQTPTYTHNYPHPYQRPYQYTYPPQPYPNYPYAQQHQEYYRKQKGDKTGFIGILSGLIGLVILNYFLGLIAILLGYFAFKDGSKKIGAFSMIIGIIDLVLPISWVFFAFF